MSNPFDDNTISDETVITIDTLVGEGRKYGNPDELAKAYNHADAALERAKADKLALEAELKVLKDITEARLNGTPPVKQEQVTQEQREQAQPQKEAVDLNKLVREELTAASEEKRKSDNINAAAEALNRVYGTPAKAQEAIRNRANELGVKFEWLRDVASDSPQAFFASMGITPNQRSNNSPGFSNEVVLRDSGSSDKDFRYWENIRKTSPNTYYSREVQKQMFAARQELGDRFFKP
jgi:hypothetical protein